jgi:SAM-dependent methyltransferase
MVISKGLACLLCCFIFQLREFLWNRLIIGLITYYFNCKFMHYYSYVDPMEYDMAISCHPFIDQMKGMLAYRLLEGFDFDPDGKTVLDVGTGTGLIVRFLKGIPGLKLFACDIDPVAEEFFKSHPEHQDILYQRIDVVAGGLKERYDGIVCSGVYHHIPKLQRPKFIKELCEHAKVVVIADEGIQEYSTDEERRSNCLKWYCFVIEEAKRRRLDGLARMESEFLKHDLLGISEDKLDYKESPSHLIKDSKKAFLFPDYLDRIGPWQLNGGGFYVATYLNVKSYIK